MAAKSVHLEGMGVLGSLLAWLLETRGIPFTWYDSQSSYNAWQASTGSIYPTGDLHDYNNYVHWQHWTVRPPWQLTGVLEAADFWFSTKTPPNGARYRVLATRAPLRLAETPSLHLNPQRFVQGTRTHFAQRVLHPGLVSPATKLVIAHGFSPERLERFSWGWSAQVQMRYPTDLPSLSGRRPAFYLRHSKYRFAFTYAYPIPGEPGWWYAGSSQISQTRAKPLTIEDKLASWKTRVEAFSQGLLCPENVQHLRQGWRPVGDEQLGETVLEQAGKLILPPLAHSGVRHAPLVCFDALKRIEDWYGA